MTLLSPRVRTVPDCLLELEGSERLGARFVSRSLQAEFHSYAEVVERAKSAAATFQRKGLDVGDRVAILLPTSISFLDAFLGVQLAGGIPSALYPPFRLGKLDQYVNRTAAMLRRIGARFVVTDDQIRVLLGRVIKDVPTLEEIIDVSQLRGNDRWSQVEVDPESPAFIQFSSGSTADPKAVQVSHTNLLINLEMLSFLFRDFTPEEAEQGGVCWLPLYHDMGLVGNLYYGLYHPGTISFLRPDDFLSKPQIWLQTLSRYRGIVSAAPDFAYGLCLSKVKDEHLEGVDLSNWRVAFNGAEPISVDVMREFSERFASWGLRASTMTPVYGLAEAVLAVTYSDTEKAPRVVDFDKDQLATEGRAIAGAGRQLPAVGKPMRGLEVEIREEGGNRLADGRLGRIVVRGPSVTQGYFNDPEATRRVFHEGWLDTGDLGFLYDGDLYVSGRIKELLIIRGRNIAPQQIEELLAGVDGLRPGCAVAVGAQLSGEAEQLVVLAERRPGTTQPDEELAGEIRERILAGVGLLAHDVCLLDPGTLPRTSSGKMRRAAALQSYLTGDLAPPDTRKLKLVKEVVRSCYALAGFWISRKQRRPSTREHEG